MTEFEDQRPVARSFLELFIPPGRIKPSETRDFIAARYELCEDLAQALCEKLQAGQLDPDRAQPEQLRRVFAGLSEASSGLTELEAAWTVCRVAELADQPLPEWALDLLPLATRPSVKPAGS